MFQVDRNKNELRKLGRITFAGAGFREREHLQEWLAKSPAALSHAIGEDLLIIQKEFDGFDGTRERLDLLALDKSGQVVVVENKLDDSGRDVVWQALKYAAYCSSLKKAEIITIFQHHLDNCSEGDAASLICEFLDEDALDELVLNQGNDQRIIFIAGNFRREVTSTVLWLREHQIDIRCVKVTPYLFCEEVLIDLQQVIPTPEAADYMIRMVEKDTEEKSAKGAQRWSHQMRHEFWGDLLEEFHNNGLDRWQNINPSRDHWLTSSLGVAGCNLVLIFLRNEIRVELNLARPSAEENKWLFDELEKSKTEIDLIVDGGLEWRRMDEKKASIVQCKQAVQGYSKENWPDMISWLNSHYRQMETAFAGRLVQLAGQLKNPR